MSSTSPITTKEGEELAAGRVGNTYGPYRFQLGHDAADGTFVPDTDVSTATALCQARDELGQVVATLIDGPPDADGYWAFETRELLDNAATFRPGLFTYDVVVTYAGVGGAVQTPFAGTWQVNARVSKAGGS